MKKSYLISLVVLLALATSCGGGGTPAPGPVGEETPSEAVVATPTPIQIVPTPTPKPLPPSPTPIPTPTPAPVPAAGTEAPTAPPVVEMVVEIPAGEFIMGSDMGDGDEQPAHTVTLEAFEIDMFEVSNADFAKFVEETGYQTEVEKEAPDEKSWRDYAEGKDNHPVVKVTWNDADAYCQWAGKRLPTEAEWEKAAKGEEGFLYPWGNEWEPAKANTKESGFRGTVAVGSFAEGASPYGVFDMAGNVWEWMADWYQPYPGSTYQSEYFGEKFKVTRGGAWFTEADKVTTSNRNTTTPSAANDDIGFRCVR
jgi:formylglycine-generating enzyme required for sulfatase activity